MSSNIQLIDPERSPAQIRQLYPLLELYSLGEPPAHTLFVLGRPPLAVLAAEAAAGAGDELLLIDPPADARQRFRLPERTAALFTGTPVESSLPLVQTVVGGVAHVRIGEHLLDIYTGRGSNMVHVPALGLLCGGPFGSDVVVPALASGSDGSDALETLRLLARLVKGRRVQLYIPHQGALSSEAGEILGRLASDVAYLHGLQRVVPQMAARGDALETVERVAESLLPGERSAPASRTIHDQNVQVLFESATSNQGSSTNS
jgi:hypothetical protein